MNEIKELQALLVGAGLLDKSDIDGKLGPKTKAALAEYRKLHPRTVIPRDNGARMDIGKLSLINPKAAESLALANLGVNTWKYLTTNPFTMAARSLFTTIVNNIANSVKRNKTKQAYVKGATIREKDLPTNVQQEIIKQAQWAIDKNEKIADAGGVEAYFLKHPNDTLHIGFPAWEYYKTTRGTRYGNDTGDYSSFDNIFGLTPETNVEHTLGHFNIHLDKDGYTITDRYDFNNGSGNYTNPQTLYERGRVFMQNYGPLEDDPEDSKIHYKLRFDYK